MGLQRSGRAAYTIGRDASPGGAAYTHAGRQSGPLACIKDTLVRSMRTGIGAGASGGGEAGCRLAGRVPRAV
jgi:hypothetical protein